MNIVFRYHRCNSIPKFKISGEAPVGTICVKMKLTNVRCDYSS